MDDHEIEPGDLILRCVDCHLDFIFNTKEQAFFCSKGLSQPKRCKTCRQLRRATIAPDENVRRAVRQAVDENRRSS
jgi:hypothetical protein